MCISSVSREATLNYCSFDFCCQNTVLAAGRANVRCGDLIELVAVQQNTIELLDDNASRTSDNRDGINQAFLCISLHVAAKCINWIPVVHRGCWPTQSEIWGKRQRDLPLPALSVKWQRCQTVPKIESRCSQSSGAIDFYLFFFHNIFLHFFCFNRSCLESPDDAQGRHSLDSNAMISPHRATHFCEAN